MGITSNRDWTPDAIMEQLVERFAAERAAEAAEVPWPIWREALKRKLTASLGVIPSREDPLDSIRLERTELEYHIRERVEFSTVLGFRVPAYVLVPKGRSGPAPAVLAFHGHGWGSREIVGLTPDGRANVDNPGIHGNYALELVKRGVTVIAPEIIGFGDRRLTADLQEGKTNNSSCNTLTAHLMMYGISLVGLRVTESLRALDYLQSREDVDSTRIGCVGFSGGGLIGTYAAALDERIRATILWGFTNTFKDSIMTVRHCIDNYVPGVLRYAELPELIGLFAPRPLFIESGERDPIFPIAGVMEAIRQLQHIYAEAGAAGNLEYDITPGSHEVSGRKAYSWLIGKLTEDTLSV